MWLPAIGSIAAKKILESANANSAYHIPLSSLSLLLEAATFVVPLAASWYPFSLALAAHYLPDEEGRQKGARPCIAMHLDLDL